MQKISADPDVASALFEILETQNILEGKSQLTLIPPDREMLKQLLAAG